MISLPITWLISGFESTYAAVRFSGPPLWIVRSWRGNRFDLGDSPAAALGRLPTVASLPPNVSFVVTIGTLGFPSQRWPNPSSRQKNVRGRGESIFRRAERRGRMPHRGGDVFRGSAQPVSPQRLTGHPLDGPKSEWCGDGVQGAEYGGSVPKRDFGRASNAQ